MVSLSTLYRLSSIVVFIQHCIYYMNQTEIGVFNGGLLNFQLSWMGLVFGFRHPSHQCRTWAQSRNVFPPSFPQISHTFLKKESLITGSGQGWLTVAANLGQSSSMPGIRCDGKRFIAAISWERHCLRFSHLLQRASEWVLRQVQGRKWWRAGSSCWQPPWRKG